MPFSRGRVRIEELAIFGGTPIFATPRPMGQLFSPRPAEFMELVRPAFGACELTGSSDMVELLEERLATFHDVAHCITVANACVGLILLMRIFAGGRQGEVIMPSFSYRGLPHLAQWAAQMPRFCDVEEDTHVLDPALVADAIDDTITSVLVVANFNGLGKIEELIDVATARGIPLFIDSVNAFGSTHRRRRLGSFGRAETFSLHATKLLNGFEGGYITTNDDELAADVRSQRHQLGMDLNELHAALGVVSLQHYDEIVNANRKRFEAYDTVLSGLSGLRTVPYHNGEPEQYNYRMTVVEVTDRWPLTRDQTVDVLRAEGALAGPYYSPPLHRSPHAPPGLAPLTLPVTESLARRFIEMPVGDRLSLDDIAGIGELLEFVRNNAGAISQRLSAAAQS